MVQLGAVSVSAQSRTEPEARVVPVPAESDVFTLFVTTLRVWSVFQGPVEVSGTTVGGGITVGV
jgi:hypothetical protein